MSHRNVTMSGVNPPFTIANAIFDCGVTDGALFNSNTKADRISDELFDDDFLSCMENTYK